MKRHGRYRVPPWIRKCIFIFERALLPIIIFQTVRTLFYPSTLDIFILGILIGCLIVFHLELV